MNHRQSTLRSESSVIEGSITSKPGTTKFNKEMTSKIHPHRDSLCIQDADTSDNYGRPSEVVS